MLCVEAGPSQPAGCALGDGRAPQRILFSHESINYILCGLLEVVGVSPRDSLGRVSRMMGAIVLISLKFSTGNETRSVL